MQLAQRYRWEAELTDGSIRTAGADLADAVRVSLIPAGGGPLPRHDIAGVPLVRRFGRGFIKAAFNNELLPGLFFWQNGRRTVLTSEDLREIVRAGDLIGKGVAGERWWPVARVTQQAVVLTAPYPGTSKPCGMQAKRLNRCQTREYVHCIVAQGFRMYVRCSDGTVCCTPEDFELYL